MERTESSNNWAGNYEFTCFMRGDSEGGLCLARLQCLIASGNCEGLVHGHIYCRILEMMVQMTSLQFNQKCLLLRFPFVCYISYFM